MHHGVWGLALVFVLQFFTSFFGVLYCSGIVTASLGGERVVGTNFSARRLIPTVPAWWHSPSFCFGFITHLCSVRRLTVFPFRRVPIALQEVVIVVRPRNRSSPIVTLLSWACVISSGFILSVGHPRQSCLRGFNWFAFHATPVVRIPYSSFHNHPTPFLRSFTILCLWHRLYSSMNDFVNLLRGVYEMSLIDSP